MRISKHIADSGFCSRREADKLLAERRVTVNGTPATVGTMFTEGDDVRVDGQGLRARIKKAGRKHVYIAFHKPAGITCTTDTSVSRNIIDFIGHVGTLVEAGTTLAPYAAALGKAIGLG